jgi:hypothetical protein
MHSLLLIPNKLNISVFDTICHKQKRTRRSSNINYIQSVSVKQKQKRFVWVHGWLTYPFRFSSTSTESSSKPSFATNAQHFMSTSLSPMASHLRTSHYHQLPHPHQHMYQSSLPHPHSHSSPTSSHQPLKRCVRCGTNNSPEWRRGPTGHKT